MQRTGQATINDVARLSGVSKKTVSRVINRSPLLGEETRRRVEQVIAELGYVPNPQARALALRRNFVIALVHDNPTAQTVMNVQQGLLEGIAGTEFELLVRPVKRGSPTVLDDLRAFIERQRPYGVFLMPPISDMQPVLDVCARLGTRMVRMSAQPGDPAITVTANDREAVRGAVTHLVAQGHRRIGHVAGPDGFCSAAERRAGFEEALAQAGIPLPRSWIASGNYTFESGLEAGGRLLELSPRPTAFFCANDDMAAGLLHAARSRGLDVPRDLSVVGFDDTPIAAHLWPPLTTVRWPSISMARTAALKLIGDEGEVEEPSRFVSTLIHRGSVAPPPPE